MIAAASLAVSASTVAAWDVLAINTTNPMHEPTRRLALSCALQQNVDFVGNDLANVPGAAAGDCCAKCAATARCTAFTWSSFNGGSCWLKTGMGATKVTTGVVSGVVSTTPATCSNEKDVDYIGNDIKNVAGPSNSCCDQCSKTVGCNAFTWSSYNGGVCYLKSSKGATKAGTGLVSGVINATSTPTPTTPTTTTPTPGDQCKIERGLDYVGNDITSVPGADASACCSKCLDVGGCNAFSWSAGVCYLKSGKGATTASLTVDSGTVSRPPPTNSCTIDANTNIIGLDIANFPRATAEECCDVCASYSGCGAFTWTTFNGGTCWLKSDVGATTTVAGSHSARVTVANPPKTHIQYALRTRSVRSKTVNLGNWLATEYWLWYDSPAYTGVWDIGNQGEYAVMRERTNRGDRAAALAAFETHRKQWITEADIRDIAASGINSVRVPVGFWIIGDDASVTKNNDMNMFAPGALKYLDVLINEWAVKYNLAVMLSLHAHMGSQNGYDHSAPYALGSVRWGWGETYQNSVQFATFLAARYKRSPAFLGLNMMNEPAGTIDMNAVFSYYKEVYRIVRADGNDCILVTSPHLGDQGAYANRDFMTTGYYNVWHEFHIYFKWGIYDNMPEWEILDRARNYRKNNLDGWPGNPLYIGEWSLATPTSDGRFSDINKLRELATIQLNQFQGASAGWAFWNYKHHDEARNVDARGWSFRYMRQLGVLPNLY